MTEIEYRQLEEFPDYAISNDKVIRNIMTGEVLKPVRVNKYGGKMVVLKKGEKKYTRSDQVLHAKAFGLELADG